jgi:hypothetical protein
MTASDNPGKSGPRLVTDPDPTIQKPSEFSFEKFRSKRDPSIGGVATLLTALPHHSIKEANDYVRLHPDQENYWSPELCFVAVPVKGMKRDTLHIIDEEVAIRNGLPSGSIQRFRLALATKPHDVFFLCHVPSQNLDNVWNFTNLTACEMAITAWVKVTSRRAENIDGYHISYAESEKAFPPPNWPKQPLLEIVKVTFAGRIIEIDDHPGLLRLRGAEQDLK